MEVELTLVFSLAPSHLVRFPSARPHVRSSHLAPPRTGTAIGNTRIPYHILKRPLARSHPVTRRTSFGPHRHDFRNTAFDCINCGPHWRSDANPLAPAVAPPNEARARSSFHDFEIFSVINNLATPHMSVLPEARAVLAPLRSRLLLNHGVATRFAWTILSLCPPGCPFFGSLKHDPQGALDHPLVTPVPVHLCT